MNEEKDINAEDSQLETHEQASSGEQPAPGEETFTDLQETHADAALPDTVDHEAHGEDPQDIETDDDHEDEAAHEDFSHLTLQEILALSEKLLAEENLKKADSQFNKLRIEVDRILAEEEQLAKDEYLVENSTDEGFVFKKPEEIETFFQHYRKNQARKKQHYTQQKQEREKNLKEKQQIIQQIRELNEATDQKGSLNKIKALQDKWKSIGSVPSAEADDLYKTYSALLDLFYDNKSIEYELKELDRKKNLEAKQDICHKAEELLSSENINEAIKALNKLHEEYKAIGPVPKESQEEVWNRFKLASDKLYDSKRQVSETYKKQLQENMKGKQALCLQLEEFVHFDSDRIKEWNVKTTEILALQTSWDKIGALPKEVSKEINKQFWSSFKTFFANKNKFFDKLETQRKENLKLKEDLCEQAEVLSQSSDWNTTADKLKLLQQEWSKIGPVPESQREAIYARFKKACDNFFDRKRNRRSDQDKVFEDNLAKKQGICKAINEMAATGKHDSTKLNNLIEDFLQTGFVPKKDMNTIVDQFMAAIDGYFDALTLEEAQREKERQRIHLQLHKEFPGFGAKIKRKEQALRKKISLLENDIATWENNLEFFSKSKAADKLKQDFTAKIAAAKEEIQGLKNELDTLLGY